jgi:IMP cyclohydrolase
MNTIKEALSGEYYGRIIILGKTSNDLNLVAYALTGRSESSRARKLQRKDNVVSTYPTNREQLKKGNPSLLIYNAIVEKPDDIRFVSVSNGAQTDLIADYANKYFNERFSTLQILYNSLLEPFKVNDIDITTFEPDVPNFTSRISGLINNYSNTGAMAIIKPSELGTRNEKSFFEFPLEQGIVKIISTYSGNNVPQGQPIPRFSGEPLEAKLTETNANNITQEIYDALGPKTGKEIISPGQDFRIGIAVVLYKSKESKSFIEQSIIQRT